MIFPLLAALSLAAPSTLALHDDDPKILDRKPPVPGTGYTAAANARPLLRSSGPGDPASPY